MPSTLGCPRSDLLSVQRDEATRLAGDGASLDQIDQVVIAPGGLDDEHAAALWLYAQQLTTAGNLPARVRVPLYED